MIHHWIFMTFLYARMLCFYSMLHFIEENNGTSVTHQSPLPFEKAHMAEVVKCKQQIPVQQQWPAEQEANIQ